MIIRFLRQQGLLFSGAATLFIGAAYTSADFFTLPASSLKDVAFLFMQWAVVMFALFPVIHLLSLNRYMFAALFPPVCLLSGVLAWFRYATGTVLTTMILDAASDNDSKITAELLTAGLYAVAAVSLLIGVLFAVWRFRSQTLNTVQNLVKGFPCLVKGLHIILAALWLAIVLSIWQIRLPVAEKIPLNLYFVTARWLAEKREYLKERPPLPGEVVCGADKPLVVFILGESLRADHLTFNGYGRNTTPYLNNEDIISFPHIYSEATLTNTSLPFLLTRADSLYPERGATERSFIDLFKRCNYYTVWLANQEPADSYVYFMRECDTLVHGNIDKSPYVFDAGWTDELLLPPFDDFVGEGKGARLIILHSIGSHWYYNAHYPSSNLNKVPNLVKVQDNSNTNLNNVPNLVKVEPGGKYFYPVVHSRVVTSNTHEEMINSYDNTVLFTDGFVFQVINRLREKNAILFYLSDHGEALGEDGLWLHANEAAAAHNPACFVWLSPEYKALYPSRYEALQTNRLRRYDVSFLFHSITESANIESAVYEANKSLFRNYQQ